MKLFNEFNPYWEEINFQQLLAFMQYDEDSSDYKHDTMDFTDGEYQCLQKELLTHIRFIPRIVNNKRQITVDRMIEKIEPCIIIYDHNDASSAKAVAYKLPDEWYILYINKKYYKCDQLDGLLKCIKYKL